MGDNVKQFTKEPVSAYPREGELADRLNSLIDEYAGEVSMVAVLGVLELKKQMIVIGSLEDE